MRGNENDVKRLEKGLESMLTLAATVDDYYNLKHSLTGPGEAEDGMSAFQFMVGLTDGLNAILSGGDIGGELNTLMDMIKLKTDFTPFLTQLLALTMNDMALLRTVGMRHMPASYAALLTQYVAEME